jgi:ABC-type multidrug transport system fused ATPase/permease subunit
MAAALLILVVMVAVGAGLNPSREQFAWFLRLRRPAWLGFEGLIPLIWLAIYICFYASAVLAWLASLSKLSLRFFQQRLSAQIWRDLSNLVHSRVLQQDYEYHLGKSTADLSSQLLGNLSRVATNVVTPTLQMLSAL